MNDLPVIDAEVFDANPPPLPFHEMWIVLASRGEVWTQPHVARWLFSSLERAEKAASWLPACWVHRRIVRIPGEAT